MHIKTLITPRYASPFQALSLSPLDVITAPRETKRLFIKVSRRRKNFAAHKRGDNINLVIDVVYSFIFYDSDMWWAVSFSPPYVNTQFAGTDSSFSILILVVSGWEIRKLFFIPTENKLNNFQVKAGGWINNKMRAVVSKSHGGKRGVDGATLIWHWCLSLSWMWPLHQFIVTGQIKNESQI